MTRKDILNEFTQIKFKLIRMMSLGDGGDASLVVEHFRVFVYYNIEG